MQSRSHQECSSDAYKMVPFKTKAAVYVFTNLNLCVNSVPSIVKIHIMQTETRDAKKKPGKSTRIWIFLKRRIFFFTWIGLQSTLNQWIRSPKPHLFQTAVQSSVLDTTLSLRTHWIYSKEHGSRLTPRSFSSWMGGWAVPPNFLARICELVEREYCFASTYWRH